MKAAVVTLSDRGFRNEREDKSGELVQMMLKEAGYEVAEYRLLPDEQAQIETVLKELSDEKEMDLILTTGGTGFSQRDCTPEATLNVATRNAPGIAEAMRYASLAITPRAMLSRGASVIRNQTLIINLPGSPKAVKENLEYILPTLSHGLATVTMVLIIPAEAMTTVTVTRMIPLIRSTIINAKIPVQEHLRMMFLYCKKSTVLSTQDCGFFIYFQN